MNESPHPSPPTAPAPLAGPLVPVPRLRPIDRQRTCVLPLDQLLDRDHLARLLWHYVQQLDLSAFPRTIHAVDGVPGREATDPALLVALWLSATLDLQAALDKAQPSPLRAADRQPPKPTTTVPKTAVGVCKSCNEQGCGPSQPKKSQPLSRKRPEAKPQAARG